MSKPKFKVGSPVIHKGSLKRGVIVEILESPTECMYLVVSDYGEEPLRARECELKQLSNISFSESLLSSRALPTARILIQKDIELVVEAVVKKLEDNCIRNHFKREK